MPSARNKRAVKRIKQALKTITPEEAQDVLSQAVEAEDKRIDELSKQGEPGSVINGEKVPTTYKYMVDHPEKYGPIVDFVPERTLPLFFNGVKVQAFAGLEMHVPKCFKDIYDRSGRELSRPLGGHLKESGYDSLVALGAGALEPEK